MNQDLAIQTVLMAIYSAAKCNADIAVADAVWIASVPMRLRQAAIEMHVVQLAAMRCIRRGAGHAALTARGLAWVHAMQMGDRKVA